MQNKIRSNQGSLMLSTAIIFLLLLIVCAASAIHINTVIYRDTQWKLNVAALQAARYIDAQQFFLGCPRKNYVLNHHRQEAVQNDAKAIADATLKSFGLPASSTITVGSTQMATGLHFPAPAASDQQKLTTVTLVLDYVPTLVGGFSVGGASMRATAVDFEGEAPGYGGLCLGVANPNGGNAVYSYIPNYSAFHVPNGANGFSNNDYKEMYASTAVSIVGSGGVVNIGNTNIGY